MTGIFLSAMAIAISGAVMPGPLLTFTVRQAFSGGLKSGVLIMLGHALLELLLIALIFMGFDILLQSTVTQAIIGAVGGVLLGWMGVGMLLGALGNTLKIETEGTASTQSLVASGFLISAMNPYFLLWWAIIGLGFLLSAYQAFGFWGAGVWFAGHIATDFLWYGFLSWLIGKTSRFLDARLYRMMVGGLGVMLVFFGINFFYGALKGFNVA